MVSRLLVQSVRFAPHVPPIQLEQVECKQGTLARPGDGSSTQPRRDGGQSAGEGGQCSINARHARSRGFFRAPAAGVKPQRQRLAFTLKGLDRATANFRRPRLGSQVNLRSEETDGPPILYGDVRANQLFSASARLGTKVVARLGTT